MPDLLLTTINARYAHAAFGLRYLMANLPPSLRTRAQIAEFDISARPLDIVEAILAAGPTVLGLGVYIWNVELSTRVVAELRRVRPDLVVVVGGPEVSHETDAQEICRIADYVVTGEADHAFGQLCEALLAGQRPDQRVIASGLPRFEPPHEPLALPYELYDDRDIASRVIYVEASRGCPFGCEFCLSSLDVPVRQVPLGTFLPAMQRLLDRGAKRLKFVDRTFNLNVAHSKAILEFFLEHFAPGMSLHFEMIPDRLPEALREPIARFPAGALQLEVGIQSFDVEVCRRISRVQDSSRAEQNLRWLRQNTGVHIHADLIAGLPGETLDGFAAGFDRLLALEPQEIQVGILKRLRGAPIARHDQQWGMVYSPYPPYEVLRTSDMDFASMQRIRRLARLWDLVANSGNFRLTLPLLWRDGRSAFHCFMDLSDWFWRQAGPAHGVSLHRLCEMLLRFLVEQRGMDVHLTAASLHEDYVRPGRRDCPPALEPYVDHAAATRSSRPRPTGLPPRQSRHLA